MALLVLSLSLWLESPASEIELDVSSTSIYHPYSNGLTKENPSLNHEGHGF